MSLATVHMSGVLNVDQAYEMWSNGAKWITAGTTCMRASAARGASGKTVGRFPSKVDCPSLRYQNWGQFQSTSKRS